MWSKALNPQAMPWRLQGPVLSPGESSPAGPSGQVEPLSGSCALGRVSEFPSSKLPEGRSCYFCAQEQLSFLPGPALQDSCLSRHPDLEAGPSRLSSQDKGWPGVPQDCS